MDLVITPVVEVVKCIMTPTCNHVEHHRVLGEKMEELKTKVEELRRRKEVIERKIQTEVVSDQEVTEVVRHWLECAEAMIAEIQKVEEKFQNVKFMCRGSLSKRVQKNIVKVKDILEKEFLEGIAVNKPPARGSILPTDPNAEGDQNRVKFRQNLEEKVMGYLMGNDVGVIGVCGQGGVGKTTLAKSINNKVSNLEDSKFDKVIWAPIPYPFSIVKLQDSIAARVMKEKLQEDESEEGRAAKLFEVMGKIKFLLILDDAWEEFTFHDVGIPIPTADNGCKVIVTSRSSQLCKQIGCNDDGLVDVETLSEEESFNLFLDTVGRDVILKNPDVEGILKDLVKECAGLPLAIVVIGRSMKGENDISGWRNALNDLRNCVESVNGWEKKIFERLKFSYDRLNNEELQNCFLFFSLYGKSKEIRKAELIESWIDGGLIKQVKTRKAMADRGKAILKRLISDCLIEDTSTSQVRMHDVMRDMALRVAGSGFLVKSGEEVGYITENGEWTEHLEKVSLIGSGISKISSEFCPNCPKLSVLLLSGNGRLRMIPDSFFKGMPSLEYLDLSGTRISALPNSVSNLKNLTTLLLRGIKELKHVPSLAELKALKKLDMYRAGIKAVPEGIEALVNLQYLDLRCPDLVEFPVGMLKVLSRLEFFAANFSSCWSNTDFVMEAKQIPARLNILEAFIGVIYNLEGLNNYVEFFHQLQKPKWYILTVEEDGSQVFPKHLLDMEGSKRVSIGDLNFQGKPVLLPNDLQQLEISHCDGVESLSENFLRAQSTSHTPSIFSNLKEFVIYSCPRMRKFSSRLLKGLPNLEEIHVSNCEQMEEIIESEGEENEITVTYNLAKLRKLVLEELPKLKRICAANGVMVCDSIETIHIYRCPRLRRIPLHLPQSSPPPSLQAIKLDSRELWELLKWDNPTTKEILLPFFKPCSARFMNF